MIRETKLELPSKRIASSGTKGSQIATTRQTSIQTLHRHVRGELDWIVIHAMDGEKACRYATVAALLDDIEHYGRHEPLSVGPPSLGYRLRKLYQQHRAISTAAGLVVLAVIFGGTVAVWQWREADKARRFAEAMQANESAARLEAESARGKEGVARIEAEAALRSAELAKEGAVRSQHQEAEARAAAERAKDEAVKSQQKEGEARMNAEAAENLALERLRESARTDLMIAKEWIAKERWDKAFAYLALAAENDPTLLPALETAAIALQSVPVTKLRFVIRDENLEDVQFTEDGKNILTLSDNTIRQWNLDGKLIQTASLIRNPDPDSGFWSNSFSEDGKWVQSISEFHSGNTSRFTLSAWKVSTGEPLIENLEAGEWPPQVVIGSGGKSIATHAKTIGGSTPTSTIKLFDVPENKFLINEDDPKGLIRHMEFSPDERFLITASLQIFIWSTQSGKIVHRLPISGVFAFSPNGKQMVTREDSGKICFWNTDTWTLDSTFKGREFSNIQSIKYSSNGRLIFTNGTDSESDSSQVIAETWDISSRRLISTVNIETSGVLSDDDEWIADGADYLSFFRLWNMKSGKFDRVFEGRGLSFSSDDRSIVCVSGNDVLIYDLEKSRIPSTHRLMDKDTSPTNHFISHKTGTSNGGWHTWDIIDRSNQEIISSYSSYVQGIRCLWLSPVGEVLVTLESDPESTGDQLHLRDADNGSDLKIIWTEEAGLWGAEIDAVAFSKDGGRILIAGHDGPHSENPKQWVFVLDTASGKRVFETDFEIGDDRRGASFRISDDGRRVAGVDLSDQMVDHSAPPRFKVWRVEDGLVIHDSELDPGNWTTSGGAGTTRVLLIDRESSIRVFDFVSADLLFAINAKGPVTCAGLSPDGNFLAHIVSGVLEERSLEHHLSEPTIRIPLPNFSSHDREWQIQYSPNGEFIIVHENRSMCWVYERKSEKFVSFSEYHRTFPDDPILPSLPDLDKLSTLTGVERNGEYFASIDDESLRIWPWIGNPKTIPTWWPGFLRLIGGMGIDESGHVSAFRLEGGERERVLAAITKENTPAAEFAKLFLRPFKVVDVSSLSSATELETARLNPNQAEAVQTPPTLDRRNP